MTTSFFYSMLPEDDELLVDETRRVGEWKPHTHAHAHTHAHTHTHTHT